MHFYFPLCEICYDLYKSNSQHNRAAFLVSWSSPSVSLVFHKSSLLGVCVAFCYINFIFDVINKLGKKLFPNDIFLSGMLSKRNDNQFMDNTVHETLRFRAGIPCNLCNVVPGTIKTFSCILDIKYAVLTP